MTLPALGSTAPNFHTRDQFGQPVSLSELRGTPVLLVFYPFAFTAVCTGELRHLRDRREAIAESGCAMYALSTDTMFTLRVFDDTENLGFPLLTDHWPHGQIARSYGVFDSTLGCAKRVSLLLDADGAVRWQHSSNLPEPRDFDAHIRAIDELVGS